MEGHQTIFPSSHIGVSLPPLLFPPLPTKQFQQPFNISDQIPPMVQKITVLSEVFGGRPPGARHFRVIAIDGLESQAVDNLIQRLSESFKARAPHFIIHVYQNPVEMMEADLRGYNHLITHWGTLWKHFLEVPFPTNAEVSLVEQQHALVTSASPHPGPLVEPICINIVRYSPLMVACKAASKMAQSDPYTEHGLWRWLADHWRGMIGPDITISGYRQDPSSKNKGIVKVEKPKTLVVAPGDSKGTTFTCSSTPRTCGHFVILVRRMALILQIIGRKFPSIEYFEGGTMVTLVEEAHEEVGAQWQMLDIFYNEADSHLSAQKSHTFVP